MKKIFFAFLVVVICVIDIQSQEFKGLKSYVDGTYNLSDKQQVDELVKYFYKLIREEKLKVYNREFPGFDNSTPYPLTIDQFNKLINTNYADTFTSINPLTLEESTNIETGENDIQKIRLVSETQFNEKTNKMTNTISRIDFLIPLKNYKTKEIVRYVIKYYVIL